jgi:hypothetical protein
VRPLLKWSPSPRGDPARVTSHVQAPTRAIGLRAERGQHSVHDLFEFPLEQVQLADPSLDHQQVFADEGEQTWSNNATALTGPGRAQRLQVPKWKTKGASAANEEQSFNGALLVPR